MNAAARNFASRDLSRLFYTMFSFSFSTTAYHEFTMVYIIHIVRLVGSLVSIVCLVDAYLLQLSLDLRTVSTNTTDICNTDAGFTFQVQDSVASIANTSRCISTLGYVHSNLVYCKTTVVVA